MHDDEFEPRLGRMRGGGKEPAYLNKVVKAAKRAGMKTGRRGRFDGSRIGRGASVARVLRSRDRYGAFRSRRAIVKIRPVGLGGKGMGGAKAHLRYIQRDGVTREGEPGQLYSADRDVADGKAFIERCDGDRRQFRIIVSAEDGDQYPDLKPFVRRLMSQMEEDLGTKLDWVAVDHFNTGHPHTHIVVRGVNDRGENLLIAREYISHGARMPFAEVRANEPIQGRLIRAVDMTSGRHALIGRSRDFTLVPWRPVLERHIGKNVSGIMRDGGISWTFGRQRSGPSIS